MSNRMTDCICEVDLGEIEPPLNAVIDLLDAMMMMTQELDEESREPFAAVIDAAHEKATLARERWQAAWKAQIRAR